MRVGVVSTLLPGLKPSVVEKTLRALEARLAAAASAIAVEERVRHEAGALVGALSHIKDQSELVVIFGASAIADRRDVVPDAILKSGGRVAHFGSRSIPAIFCCMALCRAILRGPSSAHPAARVRRKRTTSISC